MLGGGGMGMGGGGMGGGGMGGLGGGGIDMTGRGMNGGSQSPRVPNLPSMGNGGLGMLPNMGNGGLGMNQQMQSMNANNANGGSALAYACTSARVHAPTDKTRHNQPALMLHATV